MGVSQLAYQAKGTRVRHASRSRTLRHMKLCDPEFYGDLRRAYSAKPISITGQNYLLSSGFTWTAQLSACLFLLGVPQLFIVRYWSQPRHMTSGMHGINYRCFALPIHPTRGRGGGRVRAT